jgi:hypothetical protein
LPGSGKTNILRAVDWIVTNKPKFERVHSHFSKDGNTSVTLEFDNGVAELIKTSKTNKFIIDNKQSFSFTGATVPEPIAKLLNMNEINISKQLDPHFLITSTPGDIGKTINRITKIEKIDSWISKLTTISNKTKWRVEELESDCVEIEKEISQYDGVEDLEKEITQYEKLCIQFDVTHTLLENLKRITKSLKFLNERISELQNLDEGLNAEFGYLKMIIQTQELVQERIVGLSSIYQQLQVVLKKQHRINDILLEEENLEGMDELLKDIEEKSAFQRAILQWDEYEYQIKVLTSTLGFKKKAYLDAIEELGVCPVCQNQISLEHIHNLGASL